MRTYNTLPTAKRILNNFREKYDRIISEISTDLRPSYREGDGGYVYSPITERDRDFIYHAIATLSPELQTVTFDFDVENYYISPKKAINELKARRTVIENDLLKLNELREKYKNPENGVTPWPIEVTLEYHQKVLDVIDVVLDLPEIHEAINPDILEQKQQENNELKFTIYWSGLAITYISQLALYAFLILSLTYYVINKGDIWYSSLVITLLTLIHAILLRLNFIDSFKFLFSKKFKIFKKEEFISKIK